MQEIKIKKPTEYIKEAVKIYFKKENLIYFAKVMSVVVIFSSILSMASGYLTSVSSNYSSEMSSAQIFYVLAIIVSLLSIIVAFWSQTTTYLSILNIGANEFEVMKKSAKKIPLYLGVSLVLALIIVLGLILLIIPALIFGLWYSFTLLLIFDKDMKLVQALRTSKELVKGRMLKVLGRFIVFGLFNSLVTIIVSIIPFAGGILVGLLSPLFILPAYLLYKDLSINLN